MPTRYDRWRHAHGTHIPEQGRVEQVEARKEHGAMPSRLHKQGHVTSRGNVRLIVLFDGENKPPASGPLGPRGPERGRPMSAQADSDPWMEAWPKLEAFIVAGATKEQITEYTRELGRELPDARDPRPTRNKPKRATGRTGNLELNENHPWPSSHRRISAERSARPGSRLRGRVLEEGRLLYSADEPGRVAFEVRTRSEYFDFLSPQRAHRDHFLRRVVSHC